MIVFIGGMQRSGSTFSFNVARELLEARGSVYQATITDISKSLDIYKDVDHLIIKGHNTEGVWMDMLTSGEVRTICTIRKVEDSIASWMSTFGFTLERSLIDMRIWLAMFAQIRNIALVIPFAEIESRPIEVIHKIADHLGFSDASDKELSSINDRFAKSVIKTMVDRLQKNDPNVRNIGFSYHDKKTFFHRRHISSVPYSSAADRIGATAVAAIRREFADLIDADGELLDVAL